MKAIELIERIQGTNNGYLFAPSGDDMETATRCPSCFKITRTGAEPFPVRITLFPAPASRSLETPRSMPDTWRSSGWIPGGWRLAGWDFVKGQNVKTEYFEKFFLTEDEMREFHGAFLSNTHER